MKEEAKVWWKKAEKDLVAAEKSLKVGEFEWAAFQCEQAVEKALKTLAIEEMGKLLKAHELGFLARKLKLPENLVEICDELAPAYTSTRYPDAGVSGGEYGQEPASRMVENAEKV